MATSVAFMMEHGIAAGISVMVPRLNGDYGSLICIYDRDNAHLASEVAARRAPDLLFLASSVVCALEHLAEGARPAELSPQQVTCLRWVKAGKTDQEIAEIILCSVNTVRYHIKTALKDLGASNRTHAVVLAIEHRLI
ncbi:transcriptional regulator, LuxR family [Hyphomonas neptunium ATCC 15444]|uniref:Transcriptional regulator, LuxR family n=2 Tax=Hyphomonas TaxID=85 RepID=Q0C279_HYPNA|nr:transcriptional regulator, LuxR family [Hyphomonas neptunium ATCC 15444]